MKIKVPEKKKFTVDLRTIRVGTVFTGEIAERLTDIKIDSTWMKTGGTGMGILVSLITGRMLENPADSLVHNYVAYPEAMVVLEP